MAPARARPEGPAIEDDRGWALLALLASGALFVALATETGALHAAAPPTATPTSITTPITTPIAVSSTAASSDAGTVADAGSRAAGSTTRSETGAR